MPSAADNVKNDKDSGGKKVVGELSAINSVTSQVSLHSLSFRTERFLPSTECASTT